MKRPKLHAALAILVAGLSVLLPAAALAADPPTVGVSVDRGASGTRVVLTHSRPVVYNIRKSRNRIRILYAEPVRFTSSAPTVEGPHLERVEFRDERTIILGTGPEFVRHAEFELSNPFRLVIDLEGGSAAGAPAPLAPLTPETVIVLDPGHGGVEHGAIGPDGLKEKDVTLQLAKLLREQLRAVNPAIAVVLTRDEDRVMGLDERTAVANHNRADLFLSIHLNASPRSSATGSETYYLSAAATDDDARRLAALEHQGADSNGAPLRSPSGNSLDLVLWDLAQNQHLAASSTLAEAVQRYLNELTGTRNRGVRQAPFRVLMGATMPAILVEVGFISNPTEQARLRSTEYQRQIVGALAAAVGDFLKQLDTATGQRTSLH